MFEYIKELSPIGLCKTSPNPDEIIELHIAGYEAVITQIKEKYIKECNSDLVEVSSMPVCCCPECAKYIGRIYSLTGLDDRFPLFPSWLEKTKCAHCGIEVYPFIYGASFPTYVKGDVFETSNRPFVDDRPEECIDNYYKIVADYEEEQRDRKDYACLELELSDIAPKSYGAYRRMKKQKTKGYLKLVEAAAEHGIELPI